MQYFSLSELFTQDQPTESIGIDDASRSIYDFSGGQIITDRYANAACIFLRINAGQSFKLVSQQSYCFQHSVSGGFLGTSTSEKHQLWLVELPEKRFINSDKTIQSVKSMTLSGLSWDVENGFSFEIMNSEDAVIDVVMWQFNEDFSANEINSLLAIESQGYFLWGSHSCINKPADLYRHLIHGEVYDLRYSWPHHKKCFSENEAHALYTVFSGLEKTTGKVIYRYFQQQLVLSLLQRQADDGGWYHGMWTDSFECHYRLHTSGVHLLMDEFQRTGCPQVKASLQKAVEFLSKTTDQLDCGIWFLHDSLELSEQAMNSGPFKWIANKILGKSVSNMLVLNTHLDTTIAINRYGRITGDKQYQDLVISALKSTRAVLGLNSADWLYKPLFWAIGLTMLPTEQASKLSFPVRAIKRFAADYLIKKLPDIKARYPRLVMPNGYIDRELSLRTWAIDYQTINLMDLARYAYAFPDAFDESILDKAMAFTQNSGLIKRYRDLSPDKRYSVGFWSEALYYRCLAKSDMKYRQWLVEAMLECHDLGFGMAPSLLGGNGEAGLSAKRYSPTVLDNDGVLLANLSKADVIELLFVNSSDDLIKVTWQKTIQPMLSWFNSKGELVDFTDLTIKQRDWIRGVDNA
ncbi:MAG: hypothetical protein D0530_01415 [Methylococcales bacterium]|nr:MAG: hypothetical protein D0530_01415 [Methylococcales bacterium]